MYSNMYFCLFNMQAVWLDPPAQKCKIECSVAFLHATTGQGPNRLWSFIWLFPWMGAWLRANTSVLDHIWALGVGLLQPLALQALPPSGDGLKYASISRLQI